MKMLILYLVFIGTFGLCYGDLVCYHAKLLKCKFPADICTNVNEPSMCMSHAAAHCGVSDNQDVINSISFLNEMCRAGSALNDKYKENLSCIRTSLTRSAASCSAKMVEKTQELQQNVEKSEDIMREMLKLSCMFGKEVSSCKADKIEEKCGQKARSWYEEQSNAGGNQANEQMCVQLNGASITYNNLFLCLLLSAILTMKWFFY